MKPKMMLYCEAENDAVYSACRAHQHIEAEVGEKHTQVQFADMHVGAKSGRSKTRLNRKEGAGGGEKWLK